MEQNLQKAEDLTTRISDTVVGKDGGTMETCQGLSARPHLPPPGLGQRRWGVGI